MICTMNSVRLLSLVSLSYDFHITYLFLKIVSGFFDCQSNSGCDHPEKIVSYFIIGVATDDTEDKTLTASFILRKIADHA